MLKRKSLKLTDAEWNKLDDLSKKFNTTASTGTTFGNPSWRALIKAIANNEIELKEKQQ